MLFRPHRSWLQHAIIPAIAQLVEHLTVEHCSDQMVPGSIPGGRRWCREEGRRRVKGLIQEKRKEAGCCSAAWGGVPETAWGA